jgi:hypothetical protein
LRHGAVSLSGNRFACKAGVFHFPFGAILFRLSTQGLAPWATFQRRFAADLARSLVNIPTFSAVQCGRVRPARAKGGTLHLLRVDPTHNFFDQRVGIAFMFGDFGGVAGHCSIPELLPCSFKHRIPQHLNQAILPIFNVAL